MEIERWALEFPESARLRLAARLLSSVEGQVFDEADALALAETRANELDEGAVDTLDYRQTMQRIRKSLTP